MRHATFSLPGDLTTRLGVIDGQHIVEARGSLLDLIREGPESGRRRPDGRRHALADIRWHSPIPRPAKNVYCVGRNYLTHIEEGARARGQEVKIPKVPVFFTKATTSVTGPFDEIRVERSVTEQVDWEIELAVVIGVGGRNIARADALSHVFGYTIVNDVSARDVQTAHFQFFKGKSLDGFCPIGPVVVTPDEFGDPQSKQLTLRVNGVEKQNGNTGSMIFPVDVIIEWLSKGLTLEPGDIIATGTPEGVGMGRVPPEYLQDGDVMESEIKQIGTMRNRMVVTA